jgi:very-short-patch-repair endonuclease
VKTRYCIKRLQGHQPPKSPGGGLVWKNIIIIEIKRLKMFHKEYSPKYVIQLAQEMRREMTETEKILWGELNLRKLGGLRFRKQHPIGRYIADFCCPSIKLVVEVDGEIHSSQQEYDKNRDEYLIAQGYTTLRFSDKQIKENMMEVLSVIRKNIKIIPS